jgi:multidrug efflux system membrane fusion protein
MQKPRPPAEPAADATETATKPRPRRRLVRMSYVWAFLFSGALAAWMLTGDIVIGGRQDGPPIEIKGGAQTETAPQAAQPAAAPFRVRVRTISSSPRKGVITLRGRTEADALVQVRAETSGIVEAAPAVKGAFVRAGDTLCRIEKAAREASLAEAEAAFAQAEADAAASASLVDRGFATKLKVAADKARLDAARANVEKAKLELARTDVRAPFDGVVEDIVKVGDYLNAGGMMMGGQQMTNACAKLVKPDPLLVVGHVPERDVGKLKPGQTGQIRLVTGENVTGTIRFVASSADAATRTFRVELEVANPTRALRDGVTANIVIPVPPEPAHLLTPAILALNDLGEVGIRSVDDENRVRFLPVRILGDDPSGVYVAGLPDPVRVITVGQDFVSEGALVEPVEDDAAATAEINP